MQNETRNEGYTKWNKGKYTGKNIEGKETGIQINNSEQKEEINNKTEKKKNSKKWGEAEEPLRKL